MTPTAAVREAHALEATLRHLYKLEINCGMASFWDGGWDVWIGDDLNGIHAENNVDTIAEVAPWLRRNAADVVRGWRRARRAERRRAEFQKVNA